MYGAHFVYERYNSNKTTIAPYPFRFAQNVQSEIEGAPIIIIGDTMGTRLASFKKRLQDKISIELSKPIKIVNLAQNGENIHRTVKKIKSLTKPPLIIIYIGQMDQSFEYIFKTKSLIKINQNFKFYKDDRVKTALMVFPILSRFLYHPIDEIELGPTIVKDESKYEDDIFQKRAAVNFTLFQSGINDLFYYVKKKNSLIFSLTTPINLSIKPTKSCYGSITGDGEEQSNELVRLIKDKDFKAAYNLGKELVLTNPYNAKINFLYGVTLKELRMFKKAQKFQELAKVYDCANYGANPIYNSIIKKKGKEFQFEVLDFHQLLVDESQSNYVFLDEIYPQDYYLEKVIDALALKIKKRLRL